MEEKQVNPFESFDDKQINRRALLPLWIKIFCWFFMVFGVAAVCCLVMGLLGMNADLSFYGLETNQPLSVLGLSLIAIALFKGFCAFSLWFEKDNAIILSKIDAILGIAVCTFTAIIIPIMSPTPGLSLRLELLFLIPYLIKLIKIGKKWNPVYGD